MVTLLLWMDGAYVEYGIYTREVGLETLDELVRKGYFVTYKEGIQ